MKITSDLRWIAAASLDRTVRLWHFIDGRPANPAIELLGHEVELAKLEVSSDGRNLLSIDIDSHVRRWDLTATQPEKSGESLPDPPHRVRATAISPDGAWLLTGGNDGKVALLPLQGQVGPRVFESENEPIESLALDTSGRQLLVGHANGHIRRWNLAVDGTLSNPQPLDHHADAVVALSISNDGSFAVSGSWDKSAAYWRLGSNGKRIPLKLPSNHGQVLGVTITPDGKWIAASCEDGTVLVWDAVLCRVIQQAIEELGPRAKAPIEARRAGTFTIATLPSRDSSSVGTRWLSRLACQRKARDRNADTSTVRTTNVSSRIPSVSAKPSSEMPRRLPVTIDTKLPAMITPQLVMMPPVRRIPSRRPRNGPSRACSSKTRVTR